MSMFLFDTHTHTQLSQDSTTPLEDMVRSAARAGLDGMCVTDHCDLIDYEGHPVTGFDWPAAHAQLARGRALAPKGLEVSLGLELGSAVCHPETARRILREAGEELDFVLGSFHNWIGEQGNIDLYYTDFSRDPALGLRAMELCLAHTWTLVTQYPDCYDSLAHVNYPLRYVERDGGHLPLSRFEEQVRAIFTQVARTDHAMEVNTCRGTTLECWREPLRWFKECGGQLVTVGSDAHSPEYMGTGLASACRILQEAGFDRVTTFHRRRPIVHRL